MASKEMEIAIRIAGEVEASFNQALGNAKKSLSSLQKQANSVTNSLGSGVKSGISGIAKVAGAASAATLAATTAIGAAALNVGKEFESSMSQVSATMLIDKTTADGQKAYKTLEDAARKCGAETAFSATEAAEGLNYLALAGYDADKAAEALPTVLRLAGAGAMDLASASDMVTDSMAALGIEATNENLNTFADQLAQTASKANASVAQMGEAIITVGGTAKNLANGTTELNTCLGILADNGIKGAEGGTHLRNMILSLSAPTDTAITALGSLGLGMKDFTDSAGDLIPMNEIMQKLNKSLEGMGKTEKEATLKKIFNTTDLASVEAMLSNCTDRYDELSKSIENSSGAAQKMYDIQMDNLKGDIAKLESGASDLGISIFEKMSGNFRKVVQSGSKMIGDLSKSFKKDGFTGLAKTAGSCIADISKEFVKQTPKFIEMGANIIVSFAEGIEENGEDIGDSVSRLAVPISNAITKIIPSLIRSGGKIAVGLGEGLIRRLPTAIYYAVDNLTGIKLDVKGMRLTFKDWGSNLEDVFEYLKDIGTNAIESIGQVLENNKPKFDEIATALGNIRDSLGEAFTDSKPDIESFTSGTLGTLINSAVNLVDWVAKIINKMSEWGLLTPTLRGLGTAIVGIKIATFGKSVIDTTLATGKLLGQIPKLTRAFVSLKLAKIKDKIETVQIVALYAKEFLINVKNGTIALANQVKQFVLTKGAKVADAIATGAMTVATTAWNVAAGIATAVTTGLGIAINFLTSPIGLVVLAIAGLIAAGVLLYQNWDFVCAKASEFGTWVVGVFNNVYATIVGWLADLQAKFPTAFAVIGAVFTAWKDSVSGIVDGVKQTFDGIVQFINGVFSGNWKMAWEGIIKAFGGIFKTITNFVAAPMNGIISLVNQAIDAVNGLSIEIPDWAGGGTLGFSIPHIPKVQLATGGIATRSTYAEIGEAGQEAVLPLDTFWKKLNDILSTVIQGRNTNSSISELLASLKGEKGQTAKSSYRISDDGMTIYYSPVYNIYGTAGKEEINEADEMSQSKFNRMMKQYEKDRKRKKF